MPPRHIIFSRKGFDAVAGGGASPIVDGRPISLPIPTGGYPGGRRYGDLDAERAAMVPLVTRGRIGPDDLCHLDPDIDRAALATRPAGWRGAFGQTGTALSHLRRQGVGVGDLFLFFGRFRAGERSGDAWRWSGPDVHAIYGWLRVGEVIDVGVRPLPSWLSGHPHAAAGDWRGNTIYVAADRLDVPGAEGVAGSGVFRRPFVLTSPGARKALWRVPARLERHRLTYLRDDRRWRGDGVLDAQGQWQEGVAAVDDAAARWAGTVIAAHAG